MHALVLFSFLAVTLVEYLVKLTGAPAVLKFAPEMLSVVTTVLVILEGVRRGFALVAVKYRVAFIVVALILLSGILANSVGAGPIVTGARLYLRAIPFFFIPAVFSFTDTQIRQQLKLLLGIGLLQLPVAALQRYLLWTGGHFSGDDVRGTVLDSGVLSILLICVTLVLLGFFLRQRLSRLGFITLFLLLLLPTTINETKATVLLLPVGVIITILAGAPAGRRLRVLGLGLLLIAGFGAILVPVYDYFETNNPYKNERHLLDFFSSEKQVNDYMHNRKVSGLAQAKNVRRGDAIRVPFEYLEHDPIHVAFGLGIGNVSPSTLGQNFIGNYYELFQAFSITSFTIFLLELGVLGTALVFLLYALVFADALVVARSDPGLLGALAIGWVGVVVVMVLATFYTTIHGFTSLSYVYWYFSGLLAVRRTELALARLRSPSVIAVPRVAT